MENENQIRITGLKTGYILTVTASIIGIIAVFLPWVSASLTVSGVTSSLNYSGLYSFPSISYWNYINGAGLISLVLFLVSLILTVIGLTIRPSSVQNTKTGSTDIMHLFISALLLSSGLIIITLTSFNIFQVMILQSHLSSGGFFDGIYTNVGVGYGIVIALFAGVVVVIAGILGILMKFQNLSLFETGYSYQQQSQHQELYVPGSQDGLFLSYGQSSSSSDSKKRVVPVSGYGTDESPMNYCPGCGAKLDGSPFCDHCGRKIK
jgi:hypothetical protein